MVNTQNPALATYLSMCSRYCLPTPWHQSVSDPRAFRGPASPKSALRKLLAHHTEPELLEAGLVRRNADGCLAWHSALAEPEVVVVALIDPVSNCVCNLLTNQGCILGSLPPIFAILEDQHTQEALGRFERSLLLTADVEDAIALRAWGMAAVPINTLSGLTEQDELRLEKLFHLQRQPSEREEWKEQQASGKNAPPSAGDQSSPPATAASTTDSAADDPVHLTVVGWSPKTCSPAASLPVRASIEWLRHVRKLLRLNLSDVAVWRPQPTRWETIKFALELAQPSWIELALLDSLDVDLFSLDGEALVVPEPDDLATASAALDKAMLLDPRDASDRRRRAAALETYKTIWSKQILHPLIEQAQGVSNLTVRALRFHQAQLFEVSFVQTLSVRERLLCQDGAPVDFRDRSFAEWLSVSAQILSISKELSRCKQTKMFARPGRTNATRSQRFGAWDLAMHN